MKHGLFGIGVSVTACTSWWFLISSSSNLLAKVESLAFVSDSYGPSRCSGINKIYILNPTTAAKLLQYSGLGSNIGMGCLHERRVTVD